MGYHYSSELFTGILSGFFAMLPSGLIAIAAYVLSSMALYTIASRRGLNHPWLAWIPVANSYLVGSVSDQYRYVVRRERKSKRIVLLTLSIIRWVLGLIVLVQFFAVIGRGITGVMRDYSEGRIMEEIMGAVVSLLSMCLPLCAAAIACAIVRYMALYDIYKSLDPNNSALYLVLSILIGATEPFFLFFNRNKDDGMPPRKKPVQPAPAAPDSQWQPTGVPEPEWQPTPTEPEPERQPAPTAPEPEWQPTQDRPDPWEQSEQENKDYL